MSPSSRYPTWLFLGWLLILAWAPLPLGSTELWSRVLLSLLCALLASLFLLTAALRGLPLLQPLQPCRVPILLWALVPLWSTLQCLPLPLAVLDPLSPVAAELYRSLGQAQGTLSLDIGRSWLQATWSWGLWLFFIMGLLLLDTPQRARSAALFVVYCGVFQALYGSFMTLSGIEYGFLAEKTNFRGVATGTFSARNHLAGYLNMCLAIGIGLLVATLTRQHHRQWRKRARSLLDTLLGPKMRLRVLLALMVVALVLTRSRMGNTAFFSSLLVCGLALMLLQRRLHKGALILFASLMLVDFLIVGQWFGFERLAERIQTTSAETESRDEALRDTLTMIRDYPLTGVGLGAYAASFSRYQQADVADYWNYNHAHNDYLEFQAELGIVGMLPLGALVLLSLAEAARAMYRRHDALAKGLAFAAVMGILALLIHSAVDFNLQTPANAQLFTVILVLAWVAGRLPRSRRRSGEGH